MSRWTSDITASRWELLITSSDLRAEPVFYASDEVVGFASKDADEVDT
jgi:hypothetical protein